MRDTQSTQSSTASPSPAAQSPQASTEGGLQGTLDQQMLEGSGQGIEVQSSGQQTQTTARPASTDTTQQGLGFDVSSGLLAAIFALAVIMILLLARIAMKHSREQTADTPFGNTEEVPTEAPAQSAPAPAVRRQKKLTRRQRRNQASR